MGTYRVRTGNLGLWRQVKGQRGALEAAGVVVGELKRGREAATNAEDRPGHAQKRTKGARRGRRGVVRLSARERDSTKSRKSVGALVSEVTPGNHMRGREQQSHEAGDLSTGRQVDARFVRFCLVLSSFVCSRARAAGSRRNGRGWRADRQQRRAREQPQGQLARAGVSQRFAAGRHTHTRHGQTQRDGPAGQQLAHRRTPRREENCERTHRKANGDGPGKRRRCEDRYAHRRKASKHRQDAKRTERHTARDV